MAVVDADVIRFHEARSEATVARVGPVSVPRIALTPERRVFSGFASAIASAGAGKWFMPSPLPRLAANARPETHSAHRKGPRAHGNKSTAGRPSVPNARPLLVALVDESDGPCRAGAFTDRRSGAVMKWAAPRLIDGKTARPLGWTASRSRGVRRRPTFTPEPAKGGGN